MRGGVWRDAQEKLARSLLPCPALEGLHGRYARHIAYQGIACQYHIHKASARNRTLRGNWSTDNPNFGFEARCRCCRAKESRYKKRLARGAPREKQKTAIQYPGKYQGQRAGGYGRHG